MMQVDLTKFSLPDTLCQPPKAVPALQTRLLQQMVELCFRRHPFYSALMPCEGLEPRHIMTSDDLVRLPPSSKNDIGTAEKVTEH
jgi:phenylacetate-coenzyme A ligase PaaK-like adenylate-forming protein